MSDAKSSSLILGGTIAAGLLLLGLSLSNAIDQWKAMERHVTVRGVAERDVKADLALIPLTFRVAGDDLAALQRQAREQREQVMGFLKENDIKDDEITLDGLHVFDRKAQEYGGNGNNAEQTRYILSTQLSVRTVNVDAANRLGQKISDLIGKGITLGGGNENCQDRGYVHFLFTKLNDVKPEMLAEATASARKSASQFAADSGSQVGTIHNASQGYFSIVSRDAVDEDTNGGCKEIGLNQKVRVVTTIDYYLVN